MGFSNNNEEDFFESKISKKIETLSKQEILQMFRDFFDSYGLDDSMVFYEKQSTDIQEKMSEIAKLSESEIIEKILALQDFTKGDIANDITDDDIYAFKLKMHELGINFMSTENHLAILDLNTKTGIDSVEFEGIKYSVDSGRHLFSKEFECNGTSSYLWDHLGSDIPQFITVFDDSVDHSLSAHQVACHEALHMHAMTHRNILEGDITEIEKEVFSTGDKIEKFLDDSLGDRWLNSIEMNRSEALGNWLSYKQLLFGNDSYHECNRVLSMIMETSIHNVYKTTVALAQKSVEPLHAEMKLFLELVQRIKDNNGIYELSENEKILIHKLNTAIVNGYESFFKSLNNKDLDKTIESINHQYFNTSDTDKSIVLENGCIAVPFTNEMMSQADKINREYNDLKSLDEIQER